MGTREMASLMNRKATDRFVAQATRLARSTTFKDPQAAARRIREVVRTKLETLRPRVENAEKVLQRVKEREDAGELDEKTARAEAVPAKVVKTMFTTLEAMFDKADDPYTLGCVGLGADMLAANLDRSLLREETYPQDKKDRQRAAEDRIDEALVVYRRILRGLDNTQQELRIRIPEFPGPRVLH